MRRFFKHFVYFFLRMLASVRIRRMRHATIIGITGSLGKTSTKDAITHLLSRHYRVLSSQKSFNSEFGLPMTILEIPPISSPGQWPLVLFKAFFRAFFSFSAYDYLVLELGVDKAGDMDEHLRLVRPNIAVFTSIAPVHMAKGQFETVEDILEEKAKLVYAVRKDGIVYLNMDSDLLKTLEKIEKIRGKIVYYGTSEGAKLHASHVSLYDQGLRFDVHYGHVLGHFEVPVIGKHHVSVFLPAIGIALQSGMYMPDIVSHMKTFRLPPGRMSLIRGIRNSMIIDSSYNASPFATVAVLNAFCDFAEGRAQRKIFVFGNMNELGDLAEASHRDIGFVATQKGMDILVTVGDFARFAAESALKSGLTKDQVFSFPDALSAAKFVESIIQPKDYVLVKGSQNKVRLERLIKHIMQEPGTAAQVLARQDGHWRYN